MAPPIKGKEGWYEKLARIVNSTVCFSLAYALITLGGFFSMGLVGKLFGLNVTIYYFGVRLLLNGHKWTKVNITAIYSAFPFFALLFGLLMLYIYNQIKNKPTVFNLFLVWSFIIGTCVFAAQGFIASFGINRFDSLYYQNFAVVFSWWFLPPVTVYILSAFFMFLLFYFSVNYPRFLLSFSYSFSKINRTTGRRKYFIEIAVVPFIVGACVVTAITYPENTTIHTVYLVTMAISILISIIALPHLEIIKEDLSRNKALQKFNIAIILALATVVVFIELFMQRGVFIFS